ncbi:uncharacterized protein N7525_010192 [Penicillium rubens]|jgi:hypothetical protein|uniref:uncharacterized protein n=1 Tax=Penicillium rubens TaxID=1108849 RepID=UPI00239FE0D4|nr:uncharacterized protein N7525_010192 [Penicillium rubens]KAJ5284840.1 hypothetical protein N7524_000146 [Penicillium chrysogenum]KAJ5820908.1 hypothetical protein N7525_010192 [Penicillium rubens]KAJ5858556.1 hypothetical protein N7534_003833 [Penicillium rubens]
MEDDNDNGGEGPGWTLTHNMRLAIGPGAPNDRNWDDYMDAIHTAGDQGYNLPALEALHCTSWNHS